VGASDDESKKFLVGMVMDCNTMPSSDSCFHATGLFVVFGVKDVATGLRPLQK
jgi:hypothetical protein